MKHIIVALVYADVRRSKWPRINKDLNHMLPKIIGIILGLTALAIVSWKFKKTPLCSP